MSDTYTTGVVESIENEVEISRGNETRYIQTLNVREEKNANVSTVTNGNQHIPVTREQLYTPGQRVVLIEQDTSDAVRQTIIADQYRIPAMIGLAVAFLLVVVAISGKKGITSVLGMILSLLVLILYMVPHILAGENPVFVSLISSGMIAALIIYLGHGINYRSHISLFCILATLAFVALGSSLMVKLAYLSGIGDESASFVQLPGVSPINLQGLFLGGIILAALSVLDDSVVSQVSVIYQLKSVKKEISLRELWKRGMEVGRDHISTLVNTLILAYAGASLPLFILLSVNQTGQPLWYALNSQTIAEEVVRTLTGSIGLVLSIPLTTAIAAYIVQKKHLH